MSQHDDGRQCAALRWLESDVPIELVPVALLQPGESPRLKDDSKPRALRLLAPTVMPPIIVHRPTNSIIDGRDRVATARREQQDTIAARFFEGTVAEAFVLGVIVNRTTHGRPLTRQDRKADAERILDIYPGWSNHVIASTVGLTHPTVASIRKRLTGKSFQSDTRQGRDGRSRPVDANNGRRAAADLLRKDPGMYLRAVARQAGISVSTAHDVHRRLKEGREPSVSTTRCGPSVDYYVARARAVLTKLDSDPAVWQHNGGRAVSRLLHGCLYQVQQVSAVITTVPEHCLTTVAEFAASLSDAWGQLARDIRAYAKRPDAQRN